MIKRVIKSLGAGFGIERPVQPPKHDDPYELVDAIEVAAKEVIAVVRPYTMCHDATLITLFRQVVHCEKYDIPGALVECGVWKGGAAGLMARANLACGKERRDLHLFDSFQDICEPDESVDGERALCDVRRYAGAAAGTSGALTPIPGGYDAFGGPGTLEGNRHLLEDIINYDPGYIHYHKGWFQETVPASSADIGDIAILRIDGDWYHSVKVCLAYLYPKVVSGGFTIVDDYRYYEGCTKAVDEYREEHGISAFLHHADYSSKYHAYWIKP